MFDYGRTAARWEYSSPGYGEANIKLIEGLSLTLGARESKLGFFFSFDTSVNFT